MARRIRTVETRQVSDQFAVTRREISGGRRHAARRTPCEECPWKVESPIGAFPAEAYRVSAPTSYDAAMSTFACHMAGADSPATCAGFLCRHGDNNLGVRLSLTRDRIDLSRVSDGGHELYDSYRDMAIANGVDPDDPVLIPVRADHFNHFDRETGRWSFVGNKA